MAGISFEEATGSTTPTPSKGISFDEATGSSTTPTVEGKGGAAFGVYPKPGMKPEDTISGAAKTSGEAFLRGLPGTGGFIAGAGAAEALTSPVTTPLAVANPIVGGLTKLTIGLTGGMVGAAGISSVADKLSALMDPEGYAKWKASKEQYPTSAAAGEVLAGFAGSSPRVAAEEAGKFFTKPVVQRAVSGVLGGGMSAAEQYATEGKVDPTQVAVQAAGGYALPGLNVAGRAAQRVGEKVGSKIGKVLPKGKETVDTSAFEKELKEATTPEERAGILKKIETESQQRKANAPLVETAIRNKETGELERMGPKHDQTRKDATKDTHEEGFVDSYGVFHERQAAVEQAKRAGQIPEDHVLENPPGEREGLHSGDLRKAGDERFKVTEEQPAGTPKGTRGDFKEAIDNNEAQRMSLEAQAEDAARVGDEARVTSINEQIKQLEQEHAQLTKDMPPQETLAYERGDVQEYADRYSTTPESTKEAFVDWLHKSEMPLDPAKIAEYEQQFLSDIETPKEKVIKDSSAEPAVENDPKAKEFAKLTRKVSAAEKHSDPKDWTPEERAAWDRGWEEFSRARGYSEQEIADYKKYMELAAEMRSKYGDDAVMEFDMLITKGEHPDFPDIKGSVEVGDRMAVATSDAVAKAAATVDPRSIPNEEEFVKHATDIYERYGEDKALEFFEAYKENLNERSIPVPNNNEQLDNALHKVNMYETKDRSEHVIGYENNTKNGVTDEQRAKWFDMRERGEELPPEAKAILDEIDAENVALIRKAKGMGLEVGDEFISGQSRIRLFSEKERPGWKETIKKFFSNDTPMGDKVADQAKAAIERKVFGLETWTTDPKVKGAAVKKETGRVIEMHRHPEDTTYSYQDGSGKWQTVPVKKGTSIWEWKDGKKKQIGHSEKLDLKRGDTLELKVSGETPVGADGTKDTRVIKSQAVISDGKVMDIERHSPYRYLHDAEASARMANMGLRKMVREAEFVENLKKSELFKTVGHGPDQPLKDLPKGWVVPSNIDRIPQLRGWHFDPKTAAIIEDFAKVWDNSMYMNMTNALVKNMMLNPIPHMFNEVMHVWNARGFTGWVSPGRLGDLAVSGRRAWRDVGNQTQLYRDVMREGGSLLGADPRNKGYFDTIVKDAQKQMFGTPEMERTMKGVAKKLGTTVGDLYNGISEASQKAMWFTRDVMYMQLIHENMMHHEKRTGQRMELKDAIYKVERHMPNYRLPSEVLKSRALSQVLRNPKVSMFSRYHYGMVKSLANTLKDINPNNLRTPEGRKHFREGVDTMMAIGVALGVMYPLMDKLAETMFGEGAEQRRAGPFHLLHAAEQVATGEKDASALIWPVFTFNPMLLSLGQLAFNKKIFSGKQIYHPEDTAGEIASDVGEYAVKQVPQASPVIAAGTEEEGGTKLLARQFDIKAKSQKDLEREERAKKYRERTKKGRDTKRAKGTYTP